MQKNTSPLNDVSTFLEVDWSKGLQNVRPSSSTMVNLWTVTDENNDTLKVTEGNNISRNSSMKRRFVDGTSYVNKTRSNT